MLTLCELKFRLWMLTLCVRHELGSFTMLSLHILTNMHKHEIHMMMKVHEMHEEAQIQSFLFNGLGWLLSKS